VILKDWTPDEELAIESDIVRVDVLRRRNHVNADHAKPHFQNKEQEHMQTYEYLDKLPLTQKQKEAITETGYENAPTLYMICKATPIAMKQFLEVESLDELEKALWDILTPEEQQAVQEELDALKGS
jgi:hypothetical protein